MVKKTGNPYISLSHFSVMDIGVSKNHGIVSKRFIRLIKTLLQFGEEFCIVIYMLTRAYLGTNASSPAIRACLIARAI